MKNSWCTSELQRRGDFLCKIAIQSQPRQYDMQQTQFLTTSTEVKGNLLNEWSFTSY